MQHNEAYSVKRDRWKPIAFLTRLGIKRSNKAATSSSVGITDNVSSTQKSKDQLRQGPGLRPFTDKGHDIDVRHAENNATSPTSKDDPEGQDTATATHLTAALVARKDNDALRLDAMGKSDVFWNRDEWQTRTCSSTKETNLHEGSLNRQESFVSQLTDDFPSEESSITMDRISTNSHGSTVRL